MVSVSLRMGIDPSPHYQILAIVTETGSCAQSRMRPSILYTHRKKCFHMFGLVNTRKTWTCHFCPLACVFLTKSLAQY